MPSAHSRCGRHGKGVTTHCDPAPDWLTSGHLVSKDIALRATLARRTIAALLLAGVAVSGAAHAQTAASPPAIAVPPIAFTERTLPNGLRVIAIRDTNTPSVSVQVW